MTPEQDWTQDPEIVDFALGRLFMSALDQIYDLTFSGPYPPLLAEAILRARTRPSLEIVPDPKDARYVLIKMTTPNPE